MSTTALILVRRFALGAAVACLAPLGAWAEPADNAGSSKSPSWLEERVESLERGLNFFGREDKPQAPTGNVRTAQSSLADISVRLDRLENQMRQINGRLDEIQFQSRKNDEALKRFQGDVDFRFQDIEGKGGGGSTSSTKPSRRGDAGDLGGSSSGSSSSSSSSSSAGLDRRDSGLGAPPSNLGQSRSSGGGGGDAIGGLIDDDPNAPMSIRPPGAGRSSGGADDRGEDRMAARDSGMSTSVGGGGPRDMFDLGVGYVQRRDYGQAESTFRDFLRQHPDDPKASEARYWLGESLYQRKKYTDAADSFLTNFKEAPNSSKAPENMLKLGMSLNGMGKKEEACATIAEAGRKYARIKAQSDRELKRISC